MSDKPEKIFIEEKTNCSGLYWTHYSMGLAEYVRADLAKPSEQAELLADARALIDGAYDIIEIWKPTTTAEVKWRKMWLQKAKDTHGATPSL